MPSLRKILVPIDYSTGSRAAMEYAVFLAKKFDAEIVALHVFEVPPHVGAHTLVKTESGEQRLSDMIQGQAEAQSKKFLTAFSVVDGVSITPRLVEGRPGKAVLAESESGEFDMIVMGTQGKSGIARLLMGSVAEVVVRNATCPVLTVRPTE